MEKNIQPNKLTLSVFAGLAAWGYVETAPMIVGGEYQLVPTALAGFAALSCIRLTSELLASVGKAMYWLAALQPTGKSGTAEWAQYKNYKHQQIQSDQAPFWGLSIDGKKLLFDFESNAMVLGPAGSGKGHTVVVPLIFLIPHSKVIVDFKPELLAITKRGLLEMGQKVIALDPFGVHMHITGESYQLNFLDIIIEELLTAGGLKKVKTYATEFSKQLHPDAKNKQGDADFWLKGSQEIIAFFATCEAMMNGYEATMGDLSLILNDPIKLEHRLCSIVGQHLDGSPDEMGEYLFEMSDWADLHSDADLQGFLQAFRATAIGLLKQLRESEKQWSSFLTGAKQSVNPFGFGELSSAMGKTNFDINALKDGDEIVNLFIVGDASRPKATEQFIGISSWFIQTRMKQHKNKHVPVYFINDEINNYSVHGFVELLSYGRGFSMRQINFLQNLTAFGEKHGKHAIDVILSESEIKLVLPGQRSLETIDKIVKMLGERSLMSASTSIGKGKDEIRDSISESGRKLMTAEEVMRTRNGILFVRELPPILQQPVSYSEIQPLRTLADVNPFHPKPFLRKVKLKLKLPIKRSKK